MAFFGTGTPSAKIVSDGFPLFLGPFLRLLIAALVMTPFLIYNRQRLSSITRRDWIEIAIIGGIGIVAFTLFLLTGMKMVNGVVGAVVMSLSPAAMAVASVLFMNDKMGWRKTLAVTLAVVGVLVINISGKSIKAGGMELAIGSLLVFAAVCSQTAYSLVGKRVINEVRPTVVLPLAVWIAVLLFAIPGIYQALSFNYAKPTPNHWLGLLVWGVGPLAIGTVIWFHGLYRVRPSTAAGFMGAMPASALILSYIWLGDKFHYIHLVGFVLVFISIALVSWSYQIKEKQKNQEGQIR